jgi:hypothetical protein
MNRNLLMVSRDRVAFPARNSGDHRRHLLRPLMAAYVLCAGFQTPG